jgi:uncharacterized membrane protein YgaE (UPF0421/DUF939 family)
MNKSTFSFIEFLIIGLILAILVSLVFIPFSYKRYASEKELLSLRKLSNDLKIDLKKYSTELSDPRNIKLVEATEDLVSAVETSKRLSSEELTKRYQALTDLQKVIRSEPRPELLLSQTIHLLINHINDRLDNIESKMLTHWNVFIDFVLLIGFIVSCIALSKTKFIRQLFRLR